MNPGSASPRTGCETAAQDTGPLGLVHAFPEMSQVSPHPKPGAASATSQALLLPLRHFLL